MTESPVELEPNPTDHAEQEAEAPKWRSDASETEVEPFQLTGPNTHPKRTRNLIQLTDVSEVIYQKIMTSKLFPVELSSLARALCDVDKRIRAWKGLPEPGQLRPDALPSKRVKGVINLSGKDGFSESAASPTDAQPAGPSKRKFGGKRKTNSTSPPTSERTTPAGPTTEQPKTDAQTEQGNGA